MLAMPITTLQIVNYSLQNATNSGFTVSEQQTYEMLLHLII